MPSADCGARHTDNLWSLWTEGWVHRAAFRTARSALAALLAARNIRRLWLPAYACDVLAQAAASVEEIIWYSAGDRLQVHTNGLELLRAGDAVLAVNYFGRSPAADFRSFVASRPDVLWIEDRAQALAPDAPAWGHVLLYSPRKLVGVADGGLLVGSIELPEPDPSSILADEVSLWAPEDARSADPDGRAPQTWFPRFQRREAAFTVDRQPASRRTLDALTRIDAGAAIRRRSANYARLQTLLTDFALWPSPLPDFAPLAFPVLVENRDATAELMGARGVFCARHWTHLPCPKDRFPEAWALSARMLSIPCDQRYGDQDMERAAVALKAVARPSRTL